MATGWFHEWGETGLTGVRHVLGRMTRRRLLAVLLDVIIIVLAYDVILGFRFQRAVPDDFVLGSPKVLHFLVIAVVVHVGFNAGYHVYSIVNRYVGLPQASWIAGATIASVLVLLLVDLGWLFTGAFLMPLSVVLLGGATAGVAMIAVRFYSRVFQMQSLRAVRSGRRMVLVGAGSAAEMLVRQVDGTPSLDVRIVGLLDDDPQMQHMRIHNYPVLGTIDDAVRVAAEHEVEEFVIAIPSAGTREMERIYSELKNTGAAIRTLPSVSELFGGKVSLTDIRELDIEDVLGRPPVQTDLAAIASYIKGRRVLVTGAGGSIGSELCRQIASFAPEKLVLVDRDESALYALHEELRGRAFSRYSLVATHIQQSRKMRRIMEEHRPHVVFHAAAFKHVPLMEHSPDEAVLNNVMGTMVVAKAAAGAGVERFVNISTDKAADPVSVMGVSKRVAELVVRHVGAQNLQTCFCSVRFGNVLGSRGSLLPIFRRQIKEGGPLTVTHRDMTRYFMSIAEAVQLVLQAASMSTHVDEQGAVFVLEMGEPVRILELAEKMIRFAGHGVAADIQIAFTGLRPGEKLHEVLVGTLEHSAPTSHPMVFLVRPGALASETAGVTPGTGFGQKLDGLISLACHHAGRDTLVAALGELVPTYRPFALEEAGAFPVGADGQRDGAPVEQGGWRPEEAEAEAPVAS